MVPLAYHAFFSGCVSVSGALIGLLFVAISVAPHKLTGGHAPVAFEVRAGVAFISLINALVMSLVALLPGHNMETAGLTLSISGIGSVVGLGYLALRDAPSVFRKVGSFLRFAALLGLFVGQLVNAVHFASRGDGGGPSGTQAVLVIVCFLIAIDRAWELLGGTNAGFLSVFAQVVRERRASGPDGASGEDPTDR